MALFGPLDNSASGMRTYQTWLDTVAANIANANDTAPTSQRTYAPEWVVAQADSTFHTTLASAARSTAVASTSPLVIKGSDAGEIIYDPTNPIADAKGEVRQAQVDLPHQMTMMIQAERGYQANVSRDQPRQGRVRSRPEAGGLTCPSDPCRLPRRPSVPSARPGLTTSATATTRQRARAASARPPTSSTACRTSRTTPTASPFRPPWATATSVT